MKTAMQELIEYVEECLGYLEDCRTKDELSIVLNYATKLLKKEKEQIIKAHTNAYLIGEDDISVEDANEASMKYYNQTYNQNR
jgi:hypothetical protein